MGELVARWNRPTRTVRDEYMEVQRRMTALRVSLADPPGTVYPDDGLRRAVPDGGAAALARLARLEAGEPVRVAGWQVGVADDKRTFTLEADGALTPIEPEARHFTR